MLCAHFTIRYHIYDIYDTAWHSYSNFLLQRLTIHITAYQIHSAVLPCVFVTSLYLVNTRLNCFHIASVMQLIVCIHQHSQSQKEKKAFHAQCLFAQKTIKYCLFFLSESISSVVDGVIFSF